jgi:hypothetical protein
MKEKEASMPLSFNMPGSGINDWQKKPVVMPPYMGVVTNR